MNLITMVSVFKNKTMRTVILEDEVEGAHIPRKMSEIKWRI